MDPLLDRYELRDRLGRGGMATVYRAYDRQLGRFVAIKLFPAGTAADDTRRRGEATALARLSHPHLVTLFDAHLAGDGETTPSFLVMELVDGEDLRSRLDAGPLPPEQVATLTADVADALAVVHGAGMVHRDLKPANILLATSSVPGRAPIVKLADFGIAHLLGADRVTTAGTVIGTAGYLSPEQLRGADPGPAADVYAFGLVVLEALTGVRQYPGTPVEAVAARAAHDPSVPADLPDGWRGMLLAMTSADPSLRPTAAEVATMAAVMGPELAAWVPVAEAEGVPTVVMPAGNAEPGGPGATAPTQPVAAPPRRRRRLAVVLVAAGAAADRRPRRRPDSRACSRAGDDRPGRREHGEREQREREREREQREWQGQRERQQGEGQGLTRPPLRCLPRFRRVTFPSRMLRVAAFRHPAAAAPVGREGDGSHSPRLGDRGRVPGRAGGGRAAGCRRPLNPPGTVEATRGPE